LALIISRNLDVKYKLLPNNIRSEADAANVDMTLTFVFVSTA